MHPKRTAEPHIHVAPHSSTNSRQAQDIISSGLPIPNARIFDRGGLSLQHTIFLLCYVLTEPMI